MRRGIRMFEPTESRYENRSIDFAYVVQLEQTGPLATAEMLPKLARTRKCCEITMHEIHEAQHAN